MSSPAPKSGLQRLFSPRILTALVGIPLVAAIVTYGRWPFQLLVSALAILALRELQIAVRDSPNYGGRGWKVWSGVGYVALLLAIWRGLSPLWAGAFTALLLTGCVVFYGAKKGTNSSVSLGTVAITSLATSYVGLFALFFPLRQFDDGKWFWLTLACVWTCDTAAYFAGRALGKRKLTPLSPGKTLEGFIGGFVGALAAGAVVALLAHLPLGHCVTLGAILGVVAPIGDLAESFWKRELGVKDLGTLFPGHGGVLDRTDSVLFCVLATTLYLSAMKISSLFPLF